jgi:enoyl-CoA hydratase
VLRLNRPEQLNPLDKQTIRELRLLLTGLTAEGGPDGIVLTGNGDAFSAGGDLKGYQSLFTDPDEFRQFMRDFDEVCGLLESASAITVAMVNGTCVAGGLELALACDLITMSADAEIGDGHLKFGQLPGAGSSQRLVRAIGLQQARNWLLTARLFTAEEAAASGLVCLVTPPEELVKQTFELTAQAAAHTPLGRAHMKDLLRTAVSTPLAEGLQYEQDVAHRYATTSHDATEGLRAFAERRSARYRGR